MVDGADLVGSVQIRNKGTVGGNVCNAAPSADVVPALIVLGATARVGRPGRRAHAPARGALPRARPDRPRARRGAGRGSTVPKPAAGSGGAYLRHVPRREMDIAVVGVAVQLQLDGDGRTVKDARVALAVGRADADPLGRGRAGPDRQPAQRRRAAPRRRGRGRRRAPDQRRARDAPTTGASC